MSPEVTACCQDLLDAFIAKGTLIFEPEEPMEVEDLLVDQDEPPPEANPSSSNGESRTRVPYCPIIQPKLRKLLVALYKQLPGPHGAGQFHSAIMRYLVLAGLKPNGKGEWRPSGNISQDVSALLYTGRLTLYSAMNDGLQVSNEYTFAQ